MLKRIVSVFLLIAVLIIPFSSVMPVLAAAVGDVNADGYVNATDYVAIKRYVLGTLTFTNA